MLTYAFYLTIAERSGSWTGQTGGTRRLYTHQDAGTAADGVRFIYSFFFFLQLSLPLLLAHVVFAQQAQSAADRRRCQSAGWHDHIYLQSGWKCQSQSQTVGPGKGKVQKLSWTKFWRFLVSWKHKSHLAGYAAKPFWFDVFCVTLLDPAV